MWHEQVHGHAISQLSEIPDCYYVLWLVIYVPCICNLRTLIRTNATIVAEIKRVALKIDF